MPKGKPRASPTSSEAASVPTSPSKPLDFIWLGKGSAEEGSKRTIYGGFERDGEKYQLLDFVHVKSQGKQKTIIQINELWEEYLKKSRNAAQKTFVMGNVFQLAGKNGSITEEREINPTEFKFTGEIKDIEEKCIVKNKEEARNQKNFGQKENHYCINNESNGEKRDEPLLPDSPPKRARSESPNKSSNAKRRKLTPSSKNGNNHRVSLSPRINGTLHIDEESSSDEERSYKRSLKIRLAFEQQERQANREQREKWEQQSINNRFFKVSPRKNEAKNDWENIHAVQKLVEANLFSSSARGNRIPSDLLESKVEEKPDLVTPRWRIVDDYDTLWDAETDMLFNKNYKQGLLKIQEDEPKKKEAIKRESKLNHVRKIFDPNVWGEEEVGLFKELLCAYGQDWNKISGLMLSKNPFQLEEYYVNNRYDLTCELCGSTENDEQLLLCDGCDRAYHTYCLNPPLKTVPKTSWFCTKACEMLHKKRCELCKSGEDEQNMLLCDQCDKGFHLYCLNPPLQEIPKDDWSCEACKLEESNNNRKALTIALQNIVSQGETPNRVDPETNKLRALKKNSKRVTKKAEYMTGTLSGSVTYNALKHWAVSCLEEPPTHLRESTIAVVDHATIFGPQISPTDFTEEKLSEHFDSILLASELAVDKLIKNPTIENKVTEIILPNYQPVSQELDDRRYKDGNDGFGNGPRSWIFQANSGIYDIESSLKSLKKMTWFVKQHIHKIKKGDRVYIWVSGKDAGVLASGTILCDPSQMTEDKSMKKFFFAVKSFNTPQLRVNMSVDYILPKRIEKSVFVNHPMLSHLTILRQPIGTNFKLTRSEATAIEKIVSSMFGRDISTSPGNSTQLSVEYTTPTKKRRVSATSPTNLSSPSSISPSKSRDCAVCASSENPDKILSCDSCDTKYHLSCITPRLKKVPHGSWNCKKCTVLNSKACSVCSGTEDDDKMLLCDGCDEGFHLHCLDPPLVKVPKDEHWFCKSCKLSDSEVLACKLLLGNKELHLEARRLFRNSCEELCKVHQKSLSLNGSNPKKVLKQLQDITIQLGEIKHQVIGVANNCLLSWKERLLTPETEEQL